MESSIRVLWAIGLAGLLILLRLEAAGFGAAEYDEPVLGPRHPFLRRTAWYVLGLGLIAAIMSVHPAPATELGLALGDRAKAILGGFAIGALGTGQAVLFALWRYGMLRFPPAWSYPDAILNAIGTAFIDEATFRGVVLGLLLLVGLDVPVAVLIQAILYTLATRTGAPGRGGYALVLSLGVGLVCGWMTASMGTIGAAFLGHAVTRIAVFVCTGHAGHPMPRGREVEEGWEFRRPPVGWKAADDRDPTSRGG